MDSGEPRQERPGAIGEEKAGASASGSKGPGSTPDAKDPRLASRGAPAVSRRSLFKKTLGGAVLLAAAGAVPLALRKTQLRAIPASRTLLFFTPAEYSIMAAIADRVLAETVPPALASYPPGGSPELPPGFAAEIAQQPKGPTPQELDVAGRIDVFLAPSDPATASDFKQLLALFDNALFSFLGGGPPTPFTKMSFEQQDRHLGGWAHSRLDVKRTGYQALKRLSAAIYFSAPETFASLGYPGPPYELVKTVNESRDAAKREEAAKAGASSPTNASANRSAADPTRPAAASPNPSAPALTKPAASPSAPAAPAGNHSMAPAGDAQ